MYLERFLGACCCLPETSSTTNEGLVWSAATKLATTVTGLKSEEDALGRATESFGDEAAAMEAT